MSKVKPTSRKTDSLLENIKRGDRRYEYIHCGIFFIKSGYDCCD